MKVAILISSLSGGGAEFVARTWGQALVQAGHQISFLVTQPERDAAVTGSAIRSISGKGKFLGLVVRLRREIVRSNYEVVISLMPHSNLVSTITALTLPRRRRPALVISEHSLHSGMSKQGGPSFRLQLRLTRLVYRVADAFIAVSHAVAAEIVATCRVPINRVWVIRNAAAEGLLPQGRRTRAVSQYGSMSIVVPARLVPAKRPLLALQTAKRLAATSGFPVTVHFFGVGPLEEELRRAAAGLELTSEFHGWVHQWYDRVPADSIVLLPSEVEGFGNVLIEAASRSIPVVVSSRTLGAADACIPGVTGILVPGNDEQAFAEGIREASRLVVPDVSAWLRQFTIESSTQSLQSCLNFAVSQRGRDGQQPTIKRRYHQEQTESLQ